MNEIKIGKYKIGSGLRPFIIAEMSGNHNGSLDRALEIVDKAAEAGAHAIKLQTYTADTMTLDLNKDEFHISDPQSLWKGKNLYSLYKEASTPWDWHKKIFERAQKHGLIFFSSPFDASAVDFLESLQVPLYKIASFEIVDIPLIKKVAKTKKPMIISTGMATEEEIELAVNTARDYGCKELILLKCTSSYPAPAEECNIMTIPYLRERFQVHVGLSDHTLGIGVACASIARGAVAIEKHITLSRADGGVDAAFSLEPAEFKSLVEESERARVSLGTKFLGPTEIEKKSLVFRRSIYITANVKSGEVVTEKNIRCIRPGLGLAPRYFENVLGKKFKRNLSLGTALKMEDLE
jgi:pseudaminic acid synthase